ncbi:enoyl-CoA hydratase-related protein [Sphingobium sp. B2]|uniref:enoyl-CoA hydratase-related protein n=1 Tax=Sphingobium sp. B2 TaxID=2583228 RepID=UPI00119E717B|nr:enoyl-CoA hydratase-related protein [Sphingobium sp. B2]
MSYNYIKVQREGAVTVVTIDRPDAYNALNAEAHREMDAALDAYEVDDDQRVAIITGAGNRAFCAGHDLKQQATGGGLDVPENGFGGLTSRAALTKPVIAAVNGIAMGGGFEIALACDIIVAAENAAFALPEPRVGIAALAGGLQRLPRAIGLKQAMGMMLTGRKVAAREGLALGFVNEVTAGNALNVARDWANEILKCSPLSIRATKEAVLRGLAVPVETAMRDQWSYLEMRAMLESADFVEGPKAFAEKRDPQWLGR